MVGIPLRSRIAMPRLAAVACVLLFALPFVARADTPSTGLSAQGLSAQERRIADAADAGKEDAIALLAKLVERNSGTYNFAGVKAVAGMLAPEFEKLGFETQWKPMDAAG